MTTNTEALTYDHIVALALENGFKLKPQVDGRMALNDYVIDFARAVYDIGHAAAQAGPADVGEPVAWRVTGCSLLLDEDEAKTEARHIGGTAMAIPLYTAPQASPAAQGDAEDAARYRWLAGHCRSTSEHWGGRWSIIVDGPAPKSHDSEDDFDAAIDAARGEPS